MAQVFTLYEAPESPIVSKMRAADKRRCDKAILAYNSQFKTKEYEKVNDHFTGSNSDKRHQLQQVSPGEKIGPILQLQSKKSSPTKRHRQIL